MTAVRDERGNVLGFAKIMRNQTEQRSQVETYQARITALRQGEQRKNNFISTLAHELRNPLSAMSSAADLLAECEPTSPDATFAVGTVRRQVEFMGRMVADLLDVTRAATGKVELRREPIVLQDLITEAIDTSRFTSVAAEIPALSTAR